MNTKIIAFSIFVLSIIVSCNKEGKNGIDLSSSVGTPTLKYLPPSADNEEFALEELDNVKTKKEEDISTPNSLQNENKKIIKDGNISIKTQEINASKLSLDLLIKKLNAYYEREDLFNNDQQISYSLKVRIPANNFEKLILSIENGKDEVTNKSIQARDVTEEFVDIETRLENKREYLKRYKILLSKAFTISDILAIEENIRVIQEEIESKEGKLKFLTDQVSFSTLEINLFKNKDYIYKPEEQDVFFERIKNSLSYGFTSIVNLVVWFISIWPYLIFVGVGVYYIRKKLRNRNKKKDL